MHEPANKCELIETWCCLMHKCTQLLLVLIKDLLNAKLLLKPALTLCQCYLLLASVKFEPKYNIPHCRKCLWKCHPQNVCHFLYALICSTITLNVETNLSLSPSAIFIPVQDSVSYIFIKCSQIFISSWAGANRVIHLTYVKTCLSPACETLG